MSTQTIAVERFTVISAKPFDEVLAKVRAGVGHPDMQAFGKGLAAAKTEADLQALVAGAVSAVGLMEFASFDIGGVLRMELGPKAPKSARLLIGNPLIMKQMTKHVPDAASYAPVTVLIDERPDGVHLTYNKMTSYLAHYRNREALTVAKDLDDKLVTLLTSAAE